MAVQRGGTDLHSGFTRLVRARYRYEAEIYSVSLIQSEPNLETRLIMASYRIERPVPDVRLRLQVDRLIKGCLPVR